MSEIPKIARARLEQLATGAGSHPDADQMTAFLERSLGAREREQVLEHLARCAECREVVSVALGPEEAARVPQPAREFRWFEWQSLRWAAVAATFVIAVSLVFQTYRQEAPLPSFAKKAQDRQAAAPATAPPEVTKPTEGAPADEAQFRADSAAATKEKAPSSSTVAVLRDQEKETMSGPSKLDAVTRAKTGAKTGELAAGVGAGSAAGIGGGRMDDSKKLGKEGKTEAGGTFAAKAASPSAPAVAAGSVRGPAMQQQQAGALAQQTPAAPPAAREELQRQAAAEPSRAAADRAEPAKVTAQNEVVSAESAEKDADKRARPDSIGAAPADGFTESRKMMSPAAATARWSINAEGRVQRSTDSGQTWISTTLAPHIKFRTVAAAGPDVWAGGEGGALYHSSDSGAHWTRVGLPPELASATIVRVEFTDARHGTLATSAGETWATSDSGATWHKK